MHAMNESLVDKVVTSKCSSEPAWPTGWRMFLPVFGVDNKLVQWLCEQPADVGLTMVCDFQLCTAGKEQSMCSTNKATSPSKLLNDQVVSGLATTTDKELLQNGQFLIPDRASVLPRTATLEWINSKQPDSEQHANVGIDRFR